MNSFVELSSRASTSTPSDNTLLGFEVLLFRRFQQQPTLWYEWRERLWRRNDPDVDNLDKSSIINSIPDGSAQLTVTLESLVSLEALGIGDIHQDLWFLSVMLHGRPRRLIDMVHHEIERERLKKFPKSGETLMMRYLNLNNLSVLSLDSMFKFGDDNSLPREIFRCRNVKSLSLKYNSLETLHCDIGRMSNLEYLALTNNKLSVWSLPYSLTFLTKLHTLLLDNNLLDALPGFLPSLPALKTVHRHGNHNYFKSTFMWYHTDVNLRIIPVICEAQPYAEHERLQMWAAKTIIGSKWNFYEDENIVPELKDYIADVYHLFNVCHHCSNACFTSTHGYKVITFKNPYLGNTCVPFQHWACSMDCARAVEIPARLEQISAARELDNQYAEYVDECIRKFSSCRSSRSMLSCGSRSSDPSKGRSRKREPTGEGDRGSELSKGRLPLPSDSARTNCGCVLS